MSARRAAAVTVVAVVALGALAWWQIPAADPTLMATVTRGALTMEITTTGILRPTESIGYHPPVTGRDLEILELAPEGSHVEEGDLLARLDTSDLEREVERVQQELRQAQADLQTADTDRQDAAANIRTVSEGEGLLAVEEARTRYQLASKKAVRLREEYELLKPLLERGFMTREELSKTADAVDQAEEELALLKKRMDVAEQLTHPRELQRATVQLAQKEAHAQSVTARVADAESRLAQLRELIAACRIVARRPGLVVYETLATASPRRKVRVGDRVSATQGLVTIPQVNRMIVEASASEAELHHIERDQKATVRLEAFPELRLTGRVARIGTLASASVDNPLDDKRFDLIIELDPTTAELRPEMTARADIVVGAVDDALLVPVTAVFQDQGDLVIYVAGRRGAERRRVSVGASNDRWAAITEGVREGEQVMLADLSAQPVSVARAPGLTPPSTLARRAFALR